MNLIILLLAICGIITVVFLAVYELHLLKEERKKEEELRKIALFNRELEEKRQKRNAYMREYRKKKKEANK